MSGNCMESLHRILDEMPYLHSGQNLLHQAAAEGHIETVKYLIGRSMDPDDLGRMVMVLLILLIPRDSKI